MEHIFNFAINIEDEKIANSISANVESQVYRLITDEVKKIIYEKNWGGCNPYNNNPLKALVIDQIDKFLDDNKSTILETASSKLAEKLAKSKAGKELLEQLKED